MSNISIKLVTEAAELAGIQQLQKENLKHLISAEEAESQGFVTATYPLEFLQSMHYFSPSVIAKDGDTVIGYALVATKASRHENQLLDEFCTAADALVYQGMALKDIDYMVVGQLCVSKKYRGIGLAKQLYDYYRQQLESKYSFCITDVAHENKRSLQAHLKTGFRIIGTETYSGVSWHIVLWDWRKADS
jgi:predicted GNAT superfamily acetyltransferase